MSIPPLFSICFERFISFLWFAAWNTSCSCFCSEAFKFLVSIVYHAGSVLGRVVMTSWKRMYSSTAFGLSSSSSGVV
uniref:Putative secreted peptide n=1 Tax=Anopheles braziliensis TaxID=58242 RepID=A0A2M3ZNW3_9DIPT